MIRLKWSESTEDAPENEIEKLRREQVHDRLISLFQQTFGIILQLLRSFVQILLGSTGLMIFTATLLLLSVFSQVYGWDALHSAMVTWNTVLGPAIGARLLRFVVAHTFYSTAAGLLKRFIAMLLTTVSLLLPLWNAFWVLCFGSLKVALTQVGGCAAAATAKATTSFALGSADIRYTCPLR